MSGYLYSRAHRDGLAEKLKPFLGDQAEIEFEAARLELERLEPRCTPFDGKSAAHILGSLGFRRVYGRVSADRRPLYARVPA